MIVKKITMKLCNVIPAPNEIREIMKTNESVLRQARVTGICTGRKTVINKDTGEEYSPFVGQFFAIAHSAPEGEILESSLLYLPSIAEALLDGALEMDKTGAGVEFGFMIGTRLPMEGEKTPTGYVFFLHRLVEMQTDDRAARVLALLRKPGK